MDDLLAAFKTESSSNNIAHKAEKVYEKNITAANQTQEATISSTGIHKSDIEDALSPLNNKSEEENITNKIKPFRIRLKRSPMPPKIRKIEEKASLEMQSTSHTPKIILNGKSKKPKSKSKLVTTSRLVTHKTLKTKSKNQKKKLVDTINKKMYVKKYGARFFQVRVRLKRCDNPKQQKREKNKKGLSVSFVEQVEVLGSAKQSPIINASEEVTLFENESSSQEEFESPLPALRVEGSDEDATEEAAGNRTVQYTSSEIKSENKHQENDNNIDDKAITEINFEKTKINTDSTIKPLMKTMDEDLATLVESSNENGNLMSDFENSVEVEKLNATISLFDDPKVEQVDLSLNADDVDRIVNIS